MKRVMGILLVASFAMFAVACNDDDEQVIAESALPQAAKDFIAQHFADETVKRVIKDTEGSTEYEVKLANGFKLEFNANGIWREIDGYGLPVPASVLAELPEGIITYVETNHTASAVTKVELSRGNYEVDLTGGIEIVFSTTGEFIRYDD